MYRELVDSGYLLKQFNDTRVLAPNKSHKGSNTSQAQVDLPTQMDESAYSNSCLHTVPSNLEALHQDFTSNAFSKPEHDDGSRR